MCHEQILRNVNKYVQNISIARSYFAAVFSILDESEMKEMLFATTSHERTIEIFMKAIPNFRTRGNGFMVINNFQYPAEICDCKHCLYKKGKKCTLSECVCLQEQLKTHDVSFSELLKYAMKSINNRAFQIRLNKYIKESELNPILFKDDAHKEMFQKAVVIRPDADATMLSALYLLTADKLLWSRVCPAVDSSCIAFGAVKLGDIGTDAYALFATAKDLCYGTKHITISDIADKEIISPKLFEIICNAMTIRRYGKKAIEISEKNGTNQ